MKCSEVKYLLVDYINGKLNDDEKQDIDIHIKGCKICFTEHSKLLKALNYIKTHTQVKQSESYFKSLLPRIYQRIENKSINNIIKFYTKLAIPTVAAIIAIIISIKIFTSSDTYDKIYYAEENKLDKIINELSYEEIGMFNQVELGLIINGSEEYNETDKYVIRKILSSEDNMQLNDYIDVNISVRNLDESEVNMLLAILEENN